ncbi:MAG: enoyl-CoA hydratase-related protein [Bacteroidia bacterium]|nr:enoyl-CoA hydratase-related protein [Bacteroidia bacterium]MDW8333663.1 enoyl-CoA hydratase-related protein [Bacteroidia bacterium]
MEYQYILVQANVRPGVALVQINRPKELNALNRTVMEEIGAALTALDGDDSCRCVVLTGNERAFAAGADIKEMADASAIEMLKRDQFARWEVIRKTKKPIVAAVSGFCLGGGCELAMLCDMIVAAESAKFGQPEVNIGVMPGAGGTQRLTRTVGKALAMEMTLTGRFFPAQKMLEAGLVNRVVPTELYLQEALNLAEEIAQKPPLAVRLIKESVNAAYETLLDEGLLRERKNFYLLFASEDQKEGMAAFVEKRKAQWKGQ